jgi:hypothetical protein
VRTVAALMLEKFNAEFETGIEETVAIDHMREGSRQHSYGIPKAILIALVLDPCTSLLWEFQQLISQ